MSRSSELQREREVQRYLQSWQVARGSPLNVALNVDSIVQSDLRDTGYRPQASTDKALTAFAQLAVLRLNVKRAMVSLIDGSTQVILAEATRNLRLADLDGDAAGAGSSNADADSDLWLGTTVLSRPDAICEHCFTNTITVSRADGRKYSTDGLVVPDCRLDPRFKTRAYVQSEPGVRFYAGVPIVSRNGHQIGAYAVSDVRPRDGLDVDEIQFMQSVSQAIMEHLEWARDRVDRFKGERIVRGLAAFIEGCSALSDDPTPVKVELSRASSTVRPPEITVSSRRGTITRANSFFRDLESRTCDGPASRPSSRSPSQKRNSSQPKSDGLSRMFHRASDILRHATLADGVVLFGTMGANTRPATRDIRSDGRHSSDEEDTSMPVTSGSEGVGVDSSDSDTSPATRPCKILAYSLADERARAGIEQDTALSLGTLEKYYALFPKGKAFTFTEEGAGVSSEDDSASDREPAGFAGTAGEASNDTGRRRKPKMDHNELLKKIPGAKSVVFLPLFDYSEDRLAGGCFLWTSVMGRMMNLDEDLSYLRAFGNSIMSEVGRINTQKNEAAKTTFIASMSHELRSPLHGILGAAEFLRDTGTDSYQSGLINSITTCGKTLLETLNHVLDYSKINRLGRLNMRRGGNKNKLINLSSDSFESLNMTATVDLGVLVEEVVDAIAAGHTFRKLPETGYPKPPTSSTHQPSEHATEAPVSVLLDISPRASWMVRTQPGALRRIIMNLFGNSLKYTSSGFILVSLRAQESADGSKVDALIRVVDTGKGMSEEFQRSRLFVPFSQEDSFQPGTGLGLSIVKQIVDSLGGTLEVKSQQGKGTEVDVRLRLTPARDPVSPQPDDAIVAVSQQTKDLQLVLLDEHDQPSSLRTNQQCRKMNEILVETCTDWFDIKVARQGNPAETALFLCSEPPSLQTLEKHFGDPDRVQHRKTPIVVLCMNVEEAVRVSQSQRRLLAKFSDIIEIVPQPCGPRKLAKVMSSCFKRVEIMSKNPEGGVPLSPSSRVRTQPAKVSRTAHMGSQTDQTGELHRYGKSEAPAQLADPQVLSPPQSPPPLNPKTPSLSAGMNLLIQNEPQSALAQKKKLHVLLVDDNRINLQLLVMFMKKCGFSYEEAENGKEAVDKFEKANNPNSQNREGDGLERFDYVLMDISMPIMNGIEATKRIRDYERQHNLKPTTVMALTGLASADAQRDAKSAGIDVFLPKPVRFAELKKLLAHG